jgi:hypothetical protein
MFDLEKLDALFVSWAFLFQIILIIYFALRKWMLVCKLGIPISHLILHCGNALQWTYCVCVEHSGCSDKYHPAGWR